MTSLAQDLRYALRALTHTPGFFVVTVLTLALGIGATTAIFSVVDGVLLQPLPYPRSERVVQLFQIDKDGKRMSVSELNFRDWKSETRSFSAMALVHPEGQETVNGLGEPVRASATAVSHDFFAVFALSPSLGRTFSEEELHQGASPAVVVSDAFWRRHLDGVSSAIGRRVTIGNRLYTVIGVMPKAMNFPAGIELWLPHEIDVPDGGRTTHGWRVVARLADGISIAQARQDLSVVSRRLKARYGDDTWMSDGDLLTLHDRLVGDVRPTLLILLGASGFLLLIACANVVNLLVARITVRRGEIGLRLALGASRARLAQQCLTEAGIIAVSGGALGVGVAAAGVRVLISMQTGGLPRAEEVHVSWPVLAFALALSIATALVMGLLTVWHGTRGDIRASLSASQRAQAGHGTGGRARSALVVSQVALTAMLLVGAGLLGRSFLRLLDVRPGYRTENVVVLDVSLPVESGVDAPQRRVAFYQTLMTRLRGMPGVVDAGAASNFPLLGGGSDGEFLILTRPDEAVTMHDWQLLAKNPSRSGQANYTLVSGDYFRALGIPLVRGRGFTAGDTPDAPHVGVISASLARAKWPNEDPIGKIIQYGNMDGDLRPFTIVGVVGDVRDASLAAEPVPTFYAYQPQRVRSGTTLHVVMHTTGDPTALIASTRAIVRELRPDLPPVLRTIETVVAASVADRRFVLFLVTIFGAAALILSSLGVYSVVSYLVTQRRLEIAVRIALGAQRGDVLGLVLRQGALLAAIGIGAGSFGALFLTRLLRGLVFGVSTTDPLAFCGVMALLTAVALLASLMPARRAARVDPMNALRGA